MQISVDIGLKICYLISAVRKRRPTNGSIAQLGEHLPYKQRVIGSSPIVPTTSECVTYIPIFLFYSLLRIGKISKQQNKRELLQQR